MGKINSAMFMESSCNFYPIIEKDNWGKGLYNL
jgi:hypothetical protein